MNKGCNVDVRVWSFFRTFEIQIFLSIVGSSYEVQDLEAIQSIKQQLAGYMHR